MLLRSNAFIQNYRPGGSTEPKDIKMPKPGEVMGLKR